LKSWLSVCLNKKPIWARVVGNLLYC